MDPSQRENLGIIVQYKVKVKLCLGALGGELVAELPFILMHPKPEEEEPAPPTARPSPTQKTDSEIPLDTNLIQLDTEADGDDDIIFEDFARLRLKGETDAWLRGSNSIDLFDATKRKIFQNGASQLIL